jgi:ArsR family transcriptional regulator
MTELIAAASAQSTTARLDASVSVLQAVADPIRWTVLQRLTSNASCVCELQEQVPIAANLLSYHLKVLRDAGLVTTSRRGRWVDYALADDALDRLHAAIPGPPHSAVVGGSS